ncbi:MAG TPA: DUF2182 domain-containing protein [Gammaproteobacteria bacterium]|nr:DUF2182 domain-containing protein [Gammaproteobacteria bacterium]
MTGQSLPEYLLQRERWLVLAGLVLLIFLAWLYLLTGAGMAMSIQEMTRLSLLPHRNTAMIMPMPGMEEAGWGASQLIMVFFMWSIMMIAMMLPGAAAVILLYARVIRHSQKAITSPVFVPTLFFISGYLLIWLLFSVIATFIQWWLDQHHWLSMYLASNNGWLSGSLLIAVGLYQLSPFKQDCLRHCQSPAQFLSTHMRPGRKGASLMGLEHGLYCLGCCWLLMGLLFVSGIMNLVWIAVLALFVLAEKVIVPGKWLSRASAILLVSWGLVIWYSFV